MTKDMAQSSWGGQKDGAERRRGGKLKSEYIVCKINFQLKK